MAKAPTSTGSFRQLVDAYENGYFASELPDDIANLSVSRYPTLPEAENMVSDEVFNSLPDADGGYPSVSIREVTVQGSSAASLSFSLTLSRNDASRLLSIILADDIVGERVVETYRSVDQPGKLHLKVLATLTFSQCMAAFPYLEM